MPYVGELDGTLVMPAQVADDQRVTCPECGRPMTVRSAHYNQGHLVPRHFAHLSSSSIDGGGGDRPDDDRVITAGCPDERVNTHQLTVDWRRGDADRLGQARRDVSARLRVTLEG